MMKREELINKIKSKKEFREIPRDLVERVLDKISKKSLLEGEEIKLTRPHGSLRSSTLSSEKVGTTRPHGSLRSSTSSSLISFKKELSDKEKVKLTRALLRKIFSSFFYKGIFSFKGKKAEREEEKSLLSLKVLRKHISTKERLPFYEELYDRIFNRGDKTIIDLGSGVNGFSYPFLKKKINYVGVEAVGQFIEMQNDYFKENKFSAKAVHLSLFELEKLKEIIKKTEKPRVVLMFKIVDALEILERDFSKKLILEMSKISHRIILSFPTKSLSKKSKFRTERKWLFDFLKENLLISEDFKLGSERYLVLLKK